LHEDQAENMNSEFEKYLIDLMNSRITILKEYLISALEKEEHGLSYLQSFEGSIIQSPDVKNCEFLTDAGLLAEGSRLPRHNRNSYRIFRLTKAGKKLAMDLRRECMAESNPKVTLTTRL
jgi:hypothetical protein